MRVSDEEIFEALKHCHTRKELTEKLGLKDTRSLIKRLGRLEQKYDIKLKHNSDSSIPKYNHLPINNFVGTIVIFSDAHFWPGEFSDSYKILLKVIEKIKPTVIISNGDEFDGASISRFPKLGWQYVPTVAEEVKSCKEALTKIQEVGKDSRCIMTIGNHTGRLENMLANKVPEFFGVEGFSFKDHFKEWELYTSVSFNDVFMVKHRYHGGVHAAWNNVLKSGISIATGHTHRLLIRHFHDYKGVRYGIETGTLCHIYGEQFRYMENNARDWVEGFVVVTVLGNKIYPELVPVADGKTYFRGEFIFANE